MEISLELQYCALIFGLFVIPRFLVRLGLPLALSAFLMGTCASLVGWDVGHGDTIKLLATFGIVSLFLFAGLEVDLDELRTTRSLLIQHVILTSGLTALATYGLVAGFDLDIRIATLVSLALLTPSTGFILDTIDVSAVSEPSKFWIRSKAIAAEIVALFILFVVVRSASVREFAWAFLGLGLLIIGLPLVFRFFMKKVQPVAPKSEFGFLLMLALVSGMVTKHLGAYYLIGAFVVGLVARRFHGDLPRLSSRSLLRSVKSFSGFFVPFYFFSAGSGVTLDELSLKAVLIGSVLLVIFLPVRVLSVVLHRRLVLGESRVASVPVATLLLPNLVFGLVLADLVKTQFAAPPHVVGALLIYTIGATVAPSILLRLFWREKKEFSYLADSEGRIGETLWEDVPPEQSER